MAKKDPLKEAAFEIALRRLDWHTNKRMSRSSIKGVCIYDVIQVHPGAEAPSLAPVHTACHALVTGTNGTTRYYMVDVFMRSEAHDAQSRWLEFCFDTKRSPWRKHLNKVRAYRNPKGEIIGAIHFMRMKNFNGAFMKNFAIACRNASERPAVVEYWCKLVDSGKYDEYEAMLITFATAGMCMNALYGTNYAGSGHSPFFPTCTSVKRLREGPILDKGLTNLDRGTGTTDLMWCPGARYSTAYNTQLPMTPTKEDKWLNFRKREKNLAIFFTAYPTAMDRPVATIADPLVLVDVWKKQLADHHEGAK